MGYAVRKDGLGFRAVSSADDVTTSETYSEAEPAAGVEVARALYQNAAQNALDASDITALRCYKAGVAFPAAWQAYVVALRAVRANATADPAAPLPTRPAFPAGT